MISATVAGNLGRDAELTFTQGGNALLKFSVASTTRLKDKEETTWVRCALFGKRAEALSKYLTKGSRVAVAGTLSVREWNNQSGEKKTSVELNVNEVELMGGGAKAAGGSPSGQAAAKPGERTTTYEEPEWNRGGGEGEDEIPY